MGPCWLVSSPETHQNEYANSFKTVRKEQERAKFLSRNMGVKFDDLSQRQNGVMLTCFQPGDASESVWKYFQGSMRIIRNGKNFEPKYRERNSTTFLSSKIRSYCFVSSLEMHQNQYGNTFKAVRKDLERAKILNRNMVLQSAHILRFGCITSRVLMPATRSLAKVYPCLLFFYKGALPYLKNWKRGPARELPVRKAADQHTCRRGRNLIGLWLELKHQDVMGELVVEYGVSLKIFLWPVPNSLDQPVDNLCPFRALSVFRKRWSVPRPDCKSSWKP